MIIDITYFFEDIQIGQLSEQSVQDKVILLIQQTEPKILKGLLGYETYKLLMAENPESRFVDLKNGIEYTDKNGLLKKWEGLAQPTLKISLIACYVYYKYQRNQVTTTSGTGEGKTQTQNAIPISAMDKMASAWNKMVSLNKELYCFLNAKKDVYTEWYNWVTKEGPNSEFFENINSLNL